MSLSPWVMAGPAQGGAGLAARAECEGPHGKEPGEGSRSWGGRKPRFKAGLKQLRHGQPGAESRGLTPPRASGPRPRGGLLLLSWTLRVLPAPH